jgi:hypothetical protein
LSYEINSTGVVPGGQDYPDPEYLQWLEEQGYRPSREEAIKAIMAQMSKESASDRLTAAMASASAWPQADAAIYAAPPSPYADAIAWLGRQLGLSRYGQQDFERTFGDLLGLTPIGAAGSALDASAAGDFWGTVVRSAGIGLPGLARPIERLASKVAREVDDATAAVESRGLEMYNPPDMPPRPLAADYPAGARTDETGRLLDDIEGRPLVAGRIVGRTKIEGAEQALPATELDALGAAMLGKAAKRVPESTLGKGIVATTRFEAGAPVDILLSSSLSDSQLLQAYAHELAHVIEEIAGHLSTKGVVGDLQHVYAVLNRLGGAAPKGKPLQPRDFGYPRSEWPRELWAEAIRAYMANPNFLKTVSPAVAKRIRDAVNGHPRLKGIIQFNSMAAAAAAGGAGLSQEDDLVEQ